MHGVRVRCKCRVGMLAIYCPDAKFDTRSNKSWLRNQSPNNQSCRPSRTGGCPRGSHGAFSADASSRSGSHSERRIRMISKVESASSHVRADVSGATRSQRTMVAHKADLCVSVVGVITHAVLQAVEAGFEVDAFGLLGCGAEHEDGGCAEDDLVCRSGRRIAT